MHDGTHLHPANDGPRRVVHTPAALRERQRLSRELVGWEHEFIDANRGHATPPEIERALDDLTTTGEEIAALVRAFKDRFDGTIAAGAGFSVNLAYLADLLADTVTEGMTPEAARVLVAAVKRGLA